jgi:chondroitin AC lyase
VYAGADMPNTKLPFIVLQNDTLVQAVQSIDQKITEVVLFKQVSQLKTKNITLNASAPCVILIESKGNEKWLSVNDPQMDANLKQIKIALNGKTITVEMPQGELCGKPVTIKI